MAFVLQKYFASHPNLRTFGFVGGLMAPLLITSFVVRPRFERVVNGKLEQDQNDLHDIKHSLSLLNWHLKFLDDYANGKALQPLFGIGANSGKEDISKLSALENQQRVEQIERNCFERVDEW